MGRGEEEKDRETIRGAQRGREGSGGRESEREGQRM